MDVFSHNVLRRLMNINPYKSPCVPATGEEPRLPPARPGCAVVLGVVALTIPLRVAAIVSETHSWHTREAQTALIISLLGAAGCSSAAAGMLKRRAMLVKAGAALLVLSFASLVVLIVVVNLR